MPELYDTIGTGYDSTRQADPEIVSEAASLLDVRDGKQYLDVACGTGNYSVALSQLGGSWSACDVSQKMLSEATQKTADISWVLSSVENLSYASDYFDAAYCSLAIHHFSDLGLSFSEVARVLKRGGRFTLFTALPTQMENYWLNHYFPHMMQKACDKMPSYQAIRLALESAALEIVDKTLFDIKPDLQDLFLYSGKQRPELYLSPQVRNGISSFHGMCPDTELVSGLALLEADIRSQRFKEVLHRYDNDGGDYIFITARKVI